MVMVVGHANAEWHAWGTHDGSVSITSPGTATSSITSDPTYHWNKSSWSGRTGQKAFITTSDFNGMTVSDAIQSIDYDVTDGYWGDVYFNIMVQDSNGKKAILTPAYNSDSSSGFATDGSAGASGDFCVFEAEAGWVGTSAVGWYAAEFDAIKDLVITDGPFTEFPDTLTGAATAQDDPVYTAANWAAWADNSAGFDCGWESDGFLITFGQSTATGNSVTIENLAVNGSVVPEPSTICLLGFGILSLTLIRRRRKV